MHVIARQHTTDVCAYSLKQGHMFGIKYYLHHTQISILQTFIIKITLVKHVWGTNDYVSAGNRIIGSMCKISVYQATSTVSISIAIMVIMINIIFIMVVDIV